MFESISDVYDAVARLDAAAYRLARSRPGFINASVSKLTLRQYFTSVDNFWAAVSGQTDYITEQVENFIQAVGTNLPTYAMGVEIALYSIGTLFILLIGIPVAISVRLHVSGYRNRLYADNSTIYLSKCHFFEAFAYCSVIYAVFYISDETDDAWERRLCGRKPLCFCTVASIPVLLVFTAIIGVILFLLTVVAGTFVQKFPCTLRVSSSRLYLPHFNTLHT